MRAKAESLIPELLPFIVKNEKFFDHAITHSAGGLSPRVKFKDLANYEFLLPPRKQQDKIAELFWAMDEVIERDLLTLQALQQFSERFLSDAVSGKRYDDSDWVTHKFGDLGESFGG